MDMSIHKTYSSVEACKVAAMASEKGLTLLEGPYQEGSYALLCFVP